MQEVVAAIAIGSNVGDREGHVARAFEAIGGLAGTTVVAKGPVIRTKAVGLMGQGTGELGGEYLNSCVVVRTTLGARGLLDALQRIEQECGRDRAREPRWGARTLDLDVLVYGDAVIDEQGLTVPHPRMHERGFVLGPLAAIAPGMVVPGRGTVAGMVRELAIRERGRHA